MATDEFHNAGLLAERMTCDGARLTLPHVGDDMYFQNKEYIEKLLAAAGMSDAQIAAECKTSVISGGKGGARRLIDVWWLSGKAANIVMSANEHFAHNTSELHMKVFFVGKKPTSHGEFIDAIWSTKFQYTIATFRGKPRETGRRTAGHKGARIGNPKSDNHKVIYKGRDEKTGMECHLKGRQLSRIKETARERVATAPKSQPKPKFWSVLLEEAGYHAAQSLMKSFRDMGINITDYFSAVSSVSWERAAYSDDAEALDVEQETWYVSTATAKLSRQLPLIEEE